MKFVVFTAVAALWCGSLQAQPNLGPVIDPRGVINAVTQEPAPSVVAPGSLIWINGLNLGPASGATAPGLPLPTELGGVQVLINDRPAPLLSVTMSRIVAQVPWETSPGQAQVIVRRGEQSSRPARIAIQNPVPGVYTRGGAGYGELAATLEGRKLRFRATGLGPTEPRLASGEAAPTDAVVVPRAPVEVHVGGLSVKSEVQASSKAVGEFEIAIEIPESALPGDIVTVRAGNRLANLATWRLAGRPEVIHVPLPEGTPELTAFSGSDLRGGFLIASGRRGEDGCWPSVLIDVRAGKTSRIAECLTAAQNAPTPVTPTVNGSSLAALAGPPEGDLASGVSSRVLVFHPERAQAIGVELPERARAITGANGNFAALLAGEPARLAMINATTGEVELAQAGPAAGAVPGAVLNVTAIRVNLGDGLDKILTPPAATGQGQFAVVVGDDQANPTKAKVALVNAQGEVSATRDFVEGWLPLAMPGPPQPPAQGPGGGAGGGAFAAVRFPVTQVFDAQTRTLYVLSRKADDSAHGIVAFSEDQVKAIAVQSGWFIASCTPNARIFNIETSRRVAILAARTPRREFERVCQAFGFLVLDLSTQQIQALELPGQGQINAGGQVADLNDFILAPNLEGETIFVLDGVTVTTFRLDLPQGVIGFAGMVPVPNLELAVATARARIPGDAGFIVFDLKRIETRQLLLPDGFAATQFVGVLPATRKLVARGILTGNTGSQYLIYDLDSGDVSIIENPSGVAFVGGLLQQAQPGVGGPPPGGGGPPPGGAGQQPPAPLLHRVNAKANTIEAITYGEGRRQNGVMLVRVH